MGGFIFPALVDATIKSANRDFKHYGRNPKHDLHPIGHMVHFGTAGAAVHIVDVENNAYRDSTLLDLDSAARIADLQDDVHFFQRPIVARDMKRASPPQWQGFRASIWCMRPQGCTAR